jgi:hypothetical protein
MIKKKLGKLVFGWDPNALNGKGYWYIAGKDDSYARAATKAEMAKLGIPKTSEKPDPKNPKQKEQKKPDTNTEDSSAKPKSKYYNTINPKTGKPMRKRMRTGSDYEESDIIRSKSLGQLASERMMSGEGIGKSLKGAMKDKIGAKGNAIKKALDPMNMLSKLPGGLGTFAATAYGKKRGRDPKDISYFTGIQAPDKETVPEKEEKVTATKVGGKSSGGGMGRGTVGILKEIKQTIVDNFEENKKDKETQKSFEEEKKNEEDKKHKELIDAILGINSGEKQPKKEKEKSGGILSMLGDLLGSFLGKGKGLLKGVGGFAKRIGSGVKSVAKSIVGGGKNLAMKAGSKIKSAGSAVKSALGFGSKSATVASKGLDTAKSALTQARPGTAVKVAETAEKAGAALAKGGTTATKVAGAGSKLLKGGGKLLGFLKSVPGLGVIAAGADLVMKVQQVNDDLASGKIKDADYKKEITKAIGDAAAAGLLPVLGAALGSFIPGVGTLVGGLAGAGAALMGGDKVGGWLAGKAYDYFVEDKKGGDSKTASPEPSKATASPVASAKPAMPTSSGSSTQSNPTTQSKGSEASLSPNQSKEKSATLQMQQANNPGSRVTQATKENMNLKDKPEQAPTLINKTTNMISKGNGGGGGGGYGGVRNDEPVLQRIQYGNLKAV